MPSVKRALLGIPPKQPNEEPASERQIGYLRSFGYFTEKTILSLGMWQASYLIEQAIQIRESEKGAHDQQLEPRKGKSSPGFAKWVVLFVVAFLVFFGVGKLLMSRAGDSEPHSKEIPLPFSSQVTPKEGTPTAKAETAPPPAAPPVVPPPPKVIEDIDPVSGVVRKLASTLLPVTIETVDEISLRDEAGKETPIPPGVALQINKRTPGGTLTLVSSGKTYVGNEDRLLGKVRIKN